MHLTWPISTHFKSNYGNWAPSVIYKRTEATALSSKSIRLYLAKSSQVSTLPKAKSETRSKQNKDMHKCNSAYSERGVPLPVLTSGGE